MRLTKTLQQDENGDLIITFTEDELTLLGIEPNDELIVEEDVEGIILRKA